MPAARWLRHRPSARLRPARSPDRYPAGVFATLIGQYPVLEGSPDERLLATIGDQMDAGLGMLSDGSVRDALAVGLGAVVDAWRAADAVGHHLAAVAGLEPPLIKACLIGPWTAGGGARRRVRDAIEPLREVVRALFDAGAPLVQVTEPRLGDVAPDDAVALDLVEEVLGRLTADVQGHLSLAMAGGQPTSIPYTRLFSAPFGSYLFDLIRSPDDWRLCARVPTTCGLFVGVADARTAEADHESVTIWGARYAASLGGRGPARVGLSTSAGLGQLSREAAKAKLAALAEAGRKAELSGPELAALIDPADVDARSAALGRVEPRPPRR